MQKLLKGHRALVTGASSGIGEEYATQLASQGADLVIAARRVDRLKALATKLEAEYQITVDVLKADLSSPASAYELFNRATEQGREVTILINNAGIGPFGPFITGERERHVATLQLNTVALTELCHLFINHMLEHGKKSYIANIGSIASFQGVTNYAVYAGTKAYVRVFSEIMARELKDTNISMTCVCPGGTYTEFMEANGQILKESAKSVMMTAREVVDAGMKGMLSGRTVVIPGLMNKLACFLPRILPSKVALTLAQMAMDRSASVASAVNETQAPPSTKSS